MPITRVNSHEERNRTLIRSFVEEIFNEHKVSNIKRYFGTYEIMGSSQAEEGTEGFIQFLIDFFKAFPNWRANIEHIVAENNLVVAFLNGSGTHEGEFRGIQPTKKQVNIRSADLYKIENGIITGHWDVVDQLNLLKQTGVLFSDNAEREIMDTKTVWIRDYAQ